MRSTISIKKRGREYIATASGKFGGSYQGVRCGLSPQGVARFAAREMAHCVQSNPEGVVLMAPPEVLELVPGIYARILAAGDGRAHYA